MLLKTQRQSLSRQNESLKMHRSNILQKFQSLLVVHDNSFHT